MKLQNIYSMLLLAGGLTLGLAGCEDEVIVNTKDETKANELLAAIAAADEQLATLSLEKNTLTVSNAEADKLMNEYFTLKGELANPYSEPTEVHYTVTVLSSSNAVVTNGRSKGLEGASVVVEQNGLVLESASSSNGLYLFTGLKTGYVYVRVSAPDHASVEYRASIYLSSGQDVASAESFNAQTQVVLYGTSGDKAATYTGKAYANTTVLNDTLNRKYGSGATFGANANTFISAPTYNFDNLTYEWDSPSPLNLYGTSVNGWNYVSSFENALAGHKIFAYPNVETFANNDDWYTQNGKILDIIYKGIVTSTTIGADGSYTLPVVSSAYPDGLVDQIRISTDAYVAPHTRFTEWGGQYYGQADETGSVEVDVKYYNNTNGDIAPYNGDGINTVTIPSATAATVKRRVITEDWVYYANDKYIFDIAAAGESRNVNIYFAPRERD